MAIPETFYSPQEANGSHLTPEQWSGYINSLLLIFPKGGSEGFLPPHFLHSTFPKIGAKIIQYQEDDIQYFGLLLPAIKTQDRDWTLRSYWKNTADHTPHMSTKKIYNFLQENGYTDTYWYDYDKKSKEQFSGVNLQTLVGGILLGEPNINQSHEAQQLQQIIWEIYDPAYLYPHDLYHPDSGLSTRLVATVNNHVVGFLFGFYGKGYQWFGFENGFRNGVWLESQLMGINYNYRRQGLAKALKLLQRQQAIAQNLNVIHWTVDPLQAGNAFLNFNTLGGLAVRHYPDFYPFRNELNRITASRIGISWLINSSRVEIFSRSQQVIDDFQNLISDSGIEVIHPIQINGDLMQFDVENWLPSSRRILMEIPKNWTQMQNTNPELASIWRFVSDKILRILMPENQINYAITGAVKDPTFDNIYLKFEKISDVDNI